MVGVDKELQNLSLNLQEAFYVKEKIEIIYLEYRWSTG